jgi:hypothetical protein
MRYHQNRYGRPHDGDQVKRSMRHCTLATRTTHNTAAITIAWIAMLQTLTAILTRSWRNMRIAPAMRIVTGPDQSKNMP